MTRKKRTRKRRRKRRKSGSGPGQSKSYNGNLEMVEDALRKRQYERDQARRNPWITDDFEAYARERMAPERGKKEPGYNHTLAFAVKQSNLDELTKMLEREKRAQAARRGAPAAVTKVQSLQRGRTGRRKALGRRMEAAISSKKRWQQRRHKAATKLQSVRRGQKGRRAHNDEARFAAVLRSANRRSRPEDPGVIVGEHRLRVGLDGREILPQQRRREKEFRKEHGLSKKKKQGGRRKRRRRRTRRRRTRRRRR